MVFLVPVLILLFLVIFAVVLFRKQAVSTKDKDTDTTNHSERIYKDFDMYLKVTLALVAAFGYVRFEGFSDPVLGRQALQVIGGLSLAVMTTFCIFVICHHGSKIRRWTEIEWDKSFFWQELWACVSMWFLSSGIWVAAQIW